MFTFAEQRPCYWSNLFQPRWSKTCSSLMYNPYIQEYEKALSAKNVHLQINYFLNAIMILSVTDNELLLSAHEFWINTLFANDRLQTTNKYGYLASENTVNISLCGKFYSVKHSEGRKEVWIEQIRWSSQKYISKTFICTNAIIYAVPGTYSRINVRKQLHQVYHSSLKQTKAD